MKLGTDILEVFFCEPFGPKTINAIKGPLPQANMMPTGGVSIDNAHEWIKTGAVGVGGNLTASPTTPYESLHFLSLQIHLYLYKNTDAIILNKKGIRTKAFSFCVELFIVYLSL